MGANPLVVGCKKLVGISDVGVADRPKQASAHDPWAGIPARDHPAVELICIVSRPRLVDLVVPVELGRQEFARRKDPRLGRVVDVQEQARKLAEEAKEAAKENRKRD